MEIKNIDNKKIKINLLTLRNKHLIQFTDNVILALVLILAALPFAQVFVINIGITKINSFEIIYLFLILFITLRLGLGGGNRRRILPFILFLYVMAFYFLIPLMSHPDRLIVTIQQSRIYLPYFVATLLLFAGTSINPNKVLSGISIAALISSLSALYIQHYHQEILQHALLMNEDVVTSAIVYGRLYWINSILILFALIAFMQLTNTKVVSRILLLLSVIICSIAQFNTLNRTIILGLVVLLIGSAFSNIKKFMVRFYKYIIIGCLILVVINGLITSDQRVAGLYKERFFGGDQGILQIYQRDFEQGRVPIYKQYVDSINRHFILGQGLGVPFYIGPDGTMIYTSDVSIMSFILPFGVAGLICFCIFLISLFNLVKRGEDRQLAVRSKLLLLGAIAMSINLDVFSRNNFVIFFVLLVVANLNSNRELTQAV